MGHRRGAGRGAQLARNVLAGGGRYLVAALLALIVTPYALGVLGDERFGVWALAGAVRATLRLLDLGLNRSLMRAIADAGGRGRVESARPALATSRSLAAVLGVAMPVLIWLAAGWVVGDLFRVPLPLRPEAVYVVVGTAAVAGIDTMFAPYQAALDGVGRMDLTNGVDTVQRILSGLGVFIVLAAGWGLPGLVWKNLLTALIAGVAYRHLLHRRAPKLASAKPRLELAQARSLLTFGRHVQVVNLGAMVVEPVSKALLSRHVGLDAVALYELATRVTGQVGGAFLALSTALFPAAATERAAATAEESEEAVVALHVSAARYLAWLVAPAYAMLLVLAPAFTAAWLGGGYDAVALGIVLLGAGWLPAVLSTPAFVVAQAAGRERLSTTASLVTVVVAVGASVGLVRPFGLTGVFAGVAAGLAAGGLAILVGFVRVYRLSWTAAWGLDVRVAASATLGGLVAGGLAAVLGGLAPDSLIGALGGVALAGALGLAVYAVALIALRATSRAEIARLANLLRAAGSVP